MFYKQTVNNIKVVIIPLDGGLLDLNRLRFNYFKRICKKHNYNITKKEFEDSLGNMKTMYQQFPISKNYSSEEINNVIERDLFEYAKLKPDAIKKEGTEELLHFFNQRKIKVAVLSTHKIKSAIRYLQLTKLYNQIDFIIGGDSELPGLPDPAVLTTTLEQLDCQPSEAMLVANFPSLLSAGNQILMNVIYLNDLCSANETVIPRVFKIAKNNFDVINVFLFSPYDTMEIYSPLLGMSKDMDLETLNQTYHHLLEEYKNDEQLIELVRDTYHYFLGQIVSEDDYPIIEPGFFKEYSNNESNKDSSINKKNNDLSSLLKNQKNTKTSIGTDLNEVNNLIDQINGNVSNENIEENKQEKLQIEKEKTIGSKLADFGYTLIIDALVSFIALLLYVGFEDFINGPGIGASIVSKIIELYITIALAPFKLIFNGLNSLISLVPDYSTITAGNQFLSTLAIELLFAIIFNIIIIYICKLVYRLIKNIGVENEDN